MGHLHIIFGIWNIEFKAPDPLYYIKPQLHFIHICFSFVMLSFFITPDFSLVKFQLHVPCHQPMYCTKIHKCVEIMSIIFQDSL